MNDKRTLKEDISIIIAGYKILFKIDKRYIFFPIITSSINSLFPFVILYMSARILTELTGARDLQTLITYAVITISVNLILAFIKRFVDMKNSLYLDIWFVKLDLFLNDINNSMQYEHLENPETRILRDKIAHTQNAVGGGLWQLSERIGDLSYDIFTIIFSVSLTVGMFAMRAEGDLSGIADIINSPYSAVIILVVIFINAGVGMWIGKNEEGRTHTAMRGLADSNRIAFYYSGSVMDSVCGMDIRMFKQTPIILEEIKKKMLNAEYLNETASIARKYRTIRTFMNSIVNIIIFSYVGIKAFSGAFGIGLFLQYTGCVSRFVSGFSELFSDIAGFKHNNIYLKDVLEYVNMPNDMYKGTLSVDKSKNNDYEIEFRNVSFKYTSSNQYALKNVSFKFKIGERLAVVGMNGSGKTTMIKLLCRLYDPTDGVITLNGIDIKKYDYTEYMELFSVVFQDFSLFSFTLGQNLSVSVGYESKRAEKCLAMAGFSERLADMPNGLETSLYRDFEEDGVEISGGEAQKIALARALYKDTPFIVLDEPTAALDPIAEFEIYSKFNEIVEDKTAIYISHRLSSCRFCDDIAVFHEGELIQRGSHDMLIADKRGKYHELWNAQAQYYQENNEIEL